ncbi:DinB family protein [Gorillibacterium massiliense]|uniref:DinB family protein n=1 Tax=Gorillibacterium massiliense TaxID=1280390 RepID=UPI0004B248DD|nr:DinB family protein [Gorillibacterium massiliense]
MESYVFDCLERLDRSLGHVEKSILSLQHEQLWQRLRPQMNAIGNLVMHIAGNEYQHIVSAIGGQPFIRNRPAEFKADFGGDGTELLALLHDVRQKSRAILDNLSASDLEKEVEVQYSPDSKVEGYTWPIRKILLVVTEHYSYHSGQIVLLARILQENDTHLLHWRH